MKYFALFLFFVLSYTFSYAQKTIEVFKSSENSFSINLENGTKNFIFEISGINTYEEFLQVKQKMETYRGVENCFIIYDNTTKKASGNIIVYKFSNNLHLYELIKFAGIDFVKLEEKTIPYEEIKNL